MSTIKICDGCTENLRPDDRIFKITFVFNNNEHNFYRGHEYEAWNLCQECLKEPGFNITME